MSEIDPRRPRDAGPTDPEIDPRPHDSGSTGDASAPRQATLIEIAGAVFWSFFGVRKGEAMRRDVATIKPHQVIIVGILFAAMLVAVLVILVRAITRGT